MSYIRVQFPNSKKEYIYQTALNLIEGCKYNIVADNVTTYTSPVMVLGYIAKPNLPFGVKCRTITSATLHSSELLPARGIKNVYFNTEKRTTCVLWDDGTKTIVKCHEDDDWDVEKAIALCYMKRYFGNRGCYNKVLKKYVSQFYDELDG